MPALLQSDWSGVFLQRFSGTITISPRSRLADWFHLLDDPTRKSLARMIDVGMRVTWPVTHFVHNRAKIENAILRGRAEVRARLTRERPTNDGVTGPSRPASVVPIESDADSAIANRRREQTAPPVSTTRRRRGRIEPPGNGLQVEVPTATASNIPRSYTTTALGDTLRSVSSPLSAFANFRRNRSRSRSRRSISTWFRGEASSDESDDEMEGLVERDWRLDGEGEGEDVFIDSGLGSAPDSSDARNE